MLQDLHRWVDHSQSRHRLVQAVERTLKTLIMVERMKDGHRLRSRSGHCTAQHRELI